MPRPSATTIGVIVAAVLGFAFILGGIVGLVVVAIFMIVGGLVGRVLDGKLDLADYLGGRRRDDR